MGRAKIRNADIATNAAIASTKLAPWSADRSANDNKLTDLENGTDPQDAATLSQVQAAAGRPPGLKYTLLAGTGAGDPGNGNARFQSGSLLAFSATDADGNSVYEALRLLVEPFSLPTAYLTVFQDATHFAVYRILGLTTDAGTYLVFNFNTVVSTIGTGTIYVEKDLAGTTVWGGIQGDISLQADFQTALAAKENASAAIVKTNVAGQIAGVTGKSVPVDGDVMLIEDSAAANAKKSLTWANIKATLKNYFDTLYQAALGYTAENVANKATNFGTINDTLYPSVKAVNDRIAAYIASLDAVVFKGVINASTNPNYPAADAGDLYRISVAGKIGGGSGPNVEVGDILLCLVDGSVAGSHATVGANWNISQVNIDGAVIGPASAIDGHVPLFDGTTGKLLKDGLAATAVATASTLILRDADKNAALNNLIYGFTPTTPIADTTVTLTRASSFFQYFGSNFNIDLILPVVSTLDLGHPFHVLKQDGTAGGVTIKSSGGNTIKTLQPGDYCILKCIAITGTGAASWLCFIAPSRAYVDTIFAALAGFEDVGNKVNDLSSNDVLHYPSTSAVVAGLNSLLLPLADWYGDVSPSRTGEDATIYGLTTPTGIEMPVTGMKSVFRCGGIFVGNATATVQLKAKIGPIDVFDSGALSIPVDTPWNLDVLVMNTDGATLGRSVGVLSVNNVDYVFELVFDLDSGGSTWAAMPSFLFTANCDGPGADGSQVVARFATLQRIGASANQNPI